MTDKRKAALEALKWFADELKDQWDSCDLTEADCNRFEGNYKILIAALSEAPEVVTVEKAAYLLLFHSTLMTPSDCERAIRAVASAYPHGLKIIGGDNG